MQLLFVALLYLYPQVITCSPLHCSFLWHYHYLAVVAVDTRDNGICIRCPLSKLDDRIRHGSDVWWLFRMESTIQYNNQLLKEAYANDYNPIVNHCHVWTGSARTIHMNEIKPKSTFPNKGALTKKMREMVRKQNINNTPMRSSLCLCPKLLPHPFYHEWASFHAICWKRIKLNLFYLKWLELQCSSES